MQKKNQELVLKGVKVSEEDMAELQTEFETRLGRAERRVFALTKERDTVKRQLAGAIAPSTLQARDSRISQVCSPLCKNVAVPHMFSQQSGYLEFLEVFTCGC